MDESSNERESQELEAAKLRNEIPTSETPAVPSTSATAANEVAASADQPRCLHPLGIPGESTLLVASSPKIERDEVNTEEVLHSAAAASGQGLKDEAANARTASMPRSLRFALIAVSIGGAAAIGSFIGSLSPTLQEHLWPAMATNAASVRKGPPPAINTESAEVSASKVNLETWRRATGAQIEKLSERLERFELARAEPAAKLARITEAVERLEKKTAMAAASPETTGTIPSAVPATAQPKSSDKVLRDWIVREAHGGRALVENRSGELFEVTNGGLLPGLGQVESVKRQDGQWIVVTAPGVIYSAP
jgi:hypothetical protein